MRRNANSQNRQSNTTDDIATAPSRCASPSRPITAVPTTPISGVVTFGERHRYRDREHARVRDGVAGIGGVHAQRPSSARRRRANRFRECQSRVLLIDAQRGVRMKRTISQIGMTTMAPSRK